MLNEPDIVEFLDCVRCERCARIHGRLYECTLIKKHCPSGVWALPRSRLGRVAIFALLFGPPIVCPALVWWFAFGR
jgi:hypothetical protein